MNVVLVSQESDKRLRVRVVVGRRLVQVPNVWREGVPDFIKVTTVIGARMSHWKWRETKQHPSRARSGHQISCSLVSLHFLCDILAPITVEAALIYRAVKRLFPSTVQSNQRFTIIMYHEHDKVP